MTFVWAAGTIGALPALAPFAFDAVALPFEGGKSPASQDEGLAVVAAAVDVLVSTAALSFAAIVPAAACVVVAVA